MSTSQIVVALVIDLAAIAVLSYAVYYRRHGKSDLALAYLALNIGVFAAVALLAQAQGGMALGLGLFGILSIIRLRSAQISQSEVAYYFVALVLGLVNGLGAAMLPLMVAFNVLLIGVLATLDRGAPADPVTARRVVLDVVHESEDALRADLQARLGAPVVSVSVEEIDYVREVTTVVVQTLLPASQASESDRTEGDRFSDGVPVWLGRAAR